MMNEMFVKAIQDGTKIELIKTTDINGKPLDVFTGKVHRAPLATEPSVTALGASTLQSIVDFFKDMEEHDGLSVHIVHHREVSVISDIKGENRNRDTYITAKCDNIFGDNFKFGYYYPTSEFIISIQALFNETSDKGLLLNLISQIMASDVREESDNMVSQSVQVRQGVSLKAEVGVKNPWMLAPFRTFREVYQPSSPFILRIRQTAPGKLPEVALFEADGGKWKLEAIGDIKTWLKTKLGDDAVIIG